MSGGSVITSKKQYFEIKNVGKGAFGRCSLVRKVVDKQLYVVKEIKLEQFQRQHKLVGVVDDPDVEEEKAEMIQMMRDQGPLLISLKHVNIVKSFGYFEENNAFYLVMEFCDAGNLLQAITTRKTASSSSSLLPFVKNYNYFSESRVLNWTIQLAMAVTYLHDRCILHRDIKPSNIFLHNNGQIIKLGSFGISRTLNAPDGFLMGQIGTMTHMPPEMVEGRAVTLKSDIWSFGVTIYELTGLSLPFDHVNRLVLCRDICRKTPQPLPVNYSEWFRTLVETELINKEPQNRPTMRQLISDSRILNTIAEIVIESNNNAIVAGKQ